MDFQEAFSILKKEQDSIAYLKGLIANEYPTTLKALKLIDQDCTSNKRRKGYNLVKVENKKYGHIYYVRYSHQGKMLPTKFNTHTNVIEEAEKFAQENKERLVEQYLRSHDTKMYDILDKFYKPNSDFLLCEEKRNHKLSERGRKDYDLVITNKFIPFLRTKNVKNFDDITPNLLNDFQDSLLKGDIKPQTANNYYKALKRIFKYIVRKGILKENPCETVHYIPVCKEDQTARGCHELDKLQCVFSRLWKDELSYVLCLLIYTTGMRNSEIMRITTNDIVRIGNRTFFDIKKSKTPSGIRLVPVHNFTLKRFLDYCRKNSFKGTPFGKCRPETFAKANEELARKLKLSEDYLEKENITFYSGRHFWKTMMNAGGLGEDIEEFFMGHLVSSSVAKLYNHRDKQGKDRMVKKAGQVYKILDQYIFGSKA